MMPSLRRPVVPAVGLLLAALVFVTAAGAGPPGSFRGLPPMRGGMMTPAPPQPMRNPFPFVAPGMGLNQATFRPMVLPQALYGPSPLAAMSGRSTSMAPARNGGGGSSGGGPTAMPSGAAGTGQGFGPAGGMSPGYDNPYAAYTTGPGPAPAPTGGPLLGLLDEAGRPDWPLALRILPPGPDTLALRRQIDARAGEVQRQAAAGSVDPALLRAAGRDVARLRGMLAARADYLPVSRQATTEARQFLRRLGDALTTEP